MRAPASRARISARTAPSNHERHGRNRTGHGVDHFGADHRPGRGRHRPAGPRRPARECAVGRGAGFRCNHRRAALGLGHGASGATGLPPEGETYTRGTPNMWTTATGDEALGLVYLPIGNAAAIIGVRTDRKPRTNIPPRWSLSMPRPAARSGAFRPSTRASGTTTWARSRRWSISHRGGIVPAVILPSKQGEIYILDRRTGEPLHGVEERPVPGAAWSLNCAARRSPSRAIIPCASPI